MNMANSSNYVVDTDPTTTMQLSAYSNYSDGTTIEYETGLRIIKYETGTEIPISGHCSRSSAPTVIP